MADTPNLLLGYMEASQSQKHVTFNEALLALDAIVQLAVLDKDLTAPPVSPAEGDRYYVATGATGLWLGMSGKIAAYQDAAWNFYSLREGWILWVSDEDKAYAFDGTGLVVIGGGGGGGGTTSVNPTPLVGVNSTATITNRLSVASPASLFTHDGAGHQAKINKASAVDTASLLYQTAFSGRAEVGLTGDDDFHFKVSPDGTAWKDAIVIDRSTGIVNLPFTLLGGVNPNLVINGDFQINQRGYAGTALAAGSFGLDRWKASIGGATYSISGYTITLTSGGIEQVIESSLWGVSSLASSVVTISVESPSSNITVTIGSVSGTITAGTGRQSVTLTLTPADTGNLVLKLVKASSGSVTFGRVKFEIGPKASAWQARTLNDELRLAQRYYFQIFPQAPYYVIALGGVPFAGSVFGNIIFPTQMRIPPTVAISSIADFQVDTGAHTSIIFPTVTVSAATMQFLSPSATSLIVSRILTNNNTVAKITFSSEI